MSCGCSRNGDCCGESFEEKCYECGYEIEKGTETVVDGRAYIKVVHQQNNRNNFAFSLCSLIFKKHLHLILI